MTRALVGMWLFAGCRVDEICRLEPDCIIWDQAHDADTGEPFTACLLRVPANKTSAAFSKPVDPIVGQLVEAWKLVRPDQPLLVDRKTGQCRQLLFCYRGQRVGGGYLNDTIIPALCRKAGLPETDSRGALTSHRARTTIATQLLTAREPLTLADLQQWLGHKHPASTRHYAQILQRTLTAAYRRADYFARNVRTIQVLVDRGSILTGAAAGRAQPWKHYDLGDGYCGYDFFAKCPHRLACARCPFYLPKDSHRGQLLAVKEGIDTMLEQLDLTDDERAAVEGDREAVTALIHRLADVPTPAGPHSQAAGRRTGVHPTDPAPPRPSAAPRRRRWWWWWWWWWSPMTPPTQRPSRAQCDHSTGGPAQRAPSRVEQGPGVADPLQPTAGRSGRRRAGPVTGAGRHRRHQLRQRRLPHLTDLLFPPVTSR